MTGVGGGPRFLVRLADESEQVARVAELWKAQHHNGGAWGENIHGSTKAVYERLAALPTAATAQDVAAIIGNASWIGHRCDGCTEYSNDAWQIGDEPDYESHTVVLCRACIGKLVLALLEQPS